MKSKKTFVLLIVVLIVVIISAIGWYLSIDKIDETDLSLTNVLRKDKLVVGTFPQLKPMSFYDKAGRNVGYDIDVIKWIAAQLGVGLEIKELFFNDLFDAVKDGKIDMAISGISITSRRAEIVLFSMPYLDSGQSIIVSKDNTDIFGPEDLFNKKVGVPEGTTCEEVAKKYVDDQLISYHGFKEVESLLNEEIDAVISDYVSAAIFVKQNQDDLRIVGDLITEEYYGIITKKSNNSLMNEVNKILREMRLGGRLNKIEKKWLD